MPRAKYDMIYRDLKEKIEAEQYLYQEMLPSEHILITEYGCSRNTVRRAISELTAEGYVLAVDGAATATLDDVYYVNLIYCENTRGRTYYYAEAVSIMDGTEVDVELEGSLCKGRCADGPIILVDDKVYTKVDSGVMLDIMKKLFPGK